MDRQCTSQDSPCPMIVTLERVELTPLPPDKLSVAADLRIDMVKDPVTREETDLFITSQNNSGACLLTKPIGCYANYHSAGRGDRDNETLNARLQFALDQNWNGQLTFDLVAPNAGTPNELIEGLDAVEADDIELGGCSSSKPCGQQGTNWCDLWCSAANLGFVKSFIIDSFVKPQLQTAIADAISKQKCRKCNPSDPMVPDCPGEGIDSFCDCPGGGNACADEERICMSAANRGGQCVPPLLGVEQYVNTGKLLESFGADPSAQMGTMAAAGGSLQVSTGFQVGMLGGAKSTVTSACVPESAVPTPRTPATPDLASEGPAGHHVGLAISEYFLNYSMWEAHRSGAMCVNLTTAQAAPLTTGLFKTFLPSLGIVAGGANADAPMMVSLRPLNPPLVRVGEGTFTSDGKIDKPLLTVELDDLRIDFYAFIDGRYARLFTLAADVKVPMSLIAEGCPMTLLPVLGDLGQMVTIRSDVPNNSEILSEDPRALAQLIPMVLGMAEPILATALQPVALPDMNGFRLQIDKLKGVSRSGTSEDFSFLGVFADLGLTGDCESWGPKTIAQLVGARIPTREQMRVQAGMPLPWPTALIDVAAEDLPGKSRTMEFAWRVDGGLWSTWRDGPSLEVSHPALAMPGRHHIEVRARIAGQAAMVDPTPVSLLFVVDWDQPELTLVPDREANRLVVHAHDAVSPRESLRFAYRIGEGERSSFGPERPIDLSAVEAAGGVEVEAVDESGNIARAHWSAGAGAISASEAQARQIPAQENGSVGGAVGCSAAGAGLGGWLALILLPIAMRRRR
jgi:hypothetical protein